MLFKINKSRKCIKFINQSIKYNNITKERNSRDKIMIFIYQINAELEGFEELVHEENIPLFELLDTDKILLLVDMNNGKVWIWEGKNTSTKMKFISAQSAASIRDKHDVTFNISSVDEGEETAAFKILVGLV